MRDPIVRLLVLALLALSLVASAAAQETTGNETPAGGEADAANETPADGNETGEGDGATDGGDVAEPAGPLELTMETHTAGGGGYFTLQGETQRNPTIRAAPGQEVRITIVGTDSGVHNICIPPRECTAFVTAPGETQTLTFTAPESGTIEYYCAPHRAAGMRGTLSIGAATGGGEPAGEEGEITGPTIDLGQYSDACQGKVAPALAAEGIVGMPTLQDYIDACTPQEGEVEVESHGADLVIPISWGLIGLGVVGVVWVHKYYRP